VDLCDRSRSELHALLISDNLFSGLLDVSRCRELMELHAQVGQSLHFGGCRILTQAHSPVLERPSAHLKYLRLCNIVQQLMPNFPLVSLSLTRVQLKPHVRDWM